MGLTRGQGGHTLAPGKILPTVGGLRHPSREGRPVVPMPHVHVILYPHSNTNPSDAYRVAPHDAWMTYFNGLGKTYPHEDFKSYHEARICRDQHNNPSLHRKCLCEHGLVECSNQEVDPSADSPFIGLCPDCRLNRNRSVCDHSAARKDS